MYKSNQQKIFQSQLQIQNWMKTAETSNIKIQQSAKPYESYSSFLRRMEDKQNQRFHDEIKREFTLKHPHLTCCNGHIITAWCGNDGCKAKSALNCNNEECASYIKNHGECITTNKFIHITKLLSQMFDYKRNVIMKLVNIEEQIIRDIRLRRKRLIEQNYWNYLSPQSIDFIKKFYFANEGIDNIELPAFLANRIMENISNSSKKMKQNQFLVKSSIQEFRKSVTEFSIKRYQKFRQVFEKMMPQRQNIITKVNNNHKRNKNEHLNINKDQFCSPNQKQSDQFKLHEERSESLQSSSSSSSYSSSSDSQDSQDSRYIAKKKVKPNSSIPKIKLTSKSKYQAKQNANKDMQNNRSLMIRSLLHSKIIKIDNTKAINFLEKSLQKNNIRPKFSLIYRASQNLFKASKFHSFCDQSSHTLTLILTDNDSILGGYTPLKWSDCKQNQFAEDKDKKTCLLSIKKQRIFKIDDYRKAIRYKSTAGPIFGSKPGLFISNDCQNKKQSWIVHQFKYDKKKIRVVQYQVYQVSW